MSYRIKSFVSRNPDINYTHKIIIPGLFYHSSRPSDGTTW